MELSVLALWSAGIFATIEALEQIPGLRGRRWWAQVVPVLPLALGALTGPAVVPIMADAVPWLADLGPAAMVVFGAGAGAIAASGDKVLSQTVRGEDERIKGAKRE